MTDSTAFFTELSEEQLRRMIREAVAEAIAPLLPREEEAPAPARKRKLTAPQIGEVRIARPTLKLGRKTVEILGITDDQQMAKVRILSPGDQTTLAEGDEQWLRVKTLQSSYLPPEEHQNQYPNGEPK